jgi:hypothetical protein
MNPPSDSGHRRSRRDAARRRGRREALERLEERYQRGFLDARQPERPDVYGLAAPFQLGAAVFVVDDALERRAIGLDAQRSDVRQDSPESFADASAAATMALAAWSLVLC